MIEEEDLTHTEILEAIGTRLITTLFILLLFNKKL